MTVASTNLVDIYDGDDSTRDWAITFPVTGLTSADIKFYVSVGGISTLVTTAYEVDLTTPKVTYPTVASGLDVLTTNQKAVVRRTLDLKQEQIDVADQGAIPLTSIETGFDRITEMCQQIQEEVDRSVKVDFGQTTTDELIASLAASVTAAETAETNSSGYSDDASGYADDASGYADDAAASAAIIPDPSTGDVGDTMVVNAGKTGYDLEAVSPVGVLGDGTVNPTNLLSNGDFESWSAGTAVAPDGWTLGGAGAAVARNATTPSPKIGSYYAGLTRSGTDCYLFNSNYTTPEKGLVYYRGRTVTYSCWVYATVADRARLSISDGLTLTTSSYHTGNSTWQLLTVTKTIGAGTTTQLGVYNNVDTGNTTAYFDGAMLVEGSLSYAFSPKPAEEGVWADYGATSTIVGWSTLESKVIMTKKIGKIVFVNFELSGTVSDSTNLTFTVPYAKGTYPNSFRATLGQAKDNGSDLSVASKLAMTATSNVVSCSSNMSTGAWTASNAKGILGAFWYEVD